MAPKKRQAATSSSQPLPDTQKQTRASGRKRRHSDASNVSIDPPASNQGSTTAAPAKKRKKGRAASRASAEPEVIVEEDEQQHELDEHHQDVMALGGDATTERTVEESIEVSQPRSKHVSFASGTGSDGATATHATPHPRKESVKRRITISPSAKTIKRLRISDGRSSLPVAFSQDDSTDPRAIIQELQFTPLRTVLEERIRRRLRRSHLSEEQNAIEDHMKGDSRTAQELRVLRAQASQMSARIGELSLELETQRQMAIDASDDNDTLRAQDLERELINIRGRLAQHLDTHGLKDTDIDPDENMLVLDNEEHISYPMLPTPERSQSTTIVETEQTDSEVKMLSHELSQSTRNRVSLGLSQAQVEWEAERKEFQNAILAFEKEANDAKSRLSILDIELKHMGFGDNEDVLIILKSIRRSFDSVRENMEDILPDTVPEGASTQDLIEIMCANLRAFVTRLQLQHGEIHEKDTLIAELGNQVSGLLDHLAEAGIRRQRLEEQWKTLDEDNESKVREYEELQADLEASQEDIEDLKRQLREKTDEMKALHVDHVESLRSLESLKESLDNYRKEEERMTVLIQRMEKEHKITVESLTKEHELLADELETVRAEREALTQERTTTVADLEEKNALCEDLESRVGRLEEELEQVTSEIEVLRANNETERRQREAAETDLDDRNLQVEELEQKLRDSGKEANDLRMKMFGLQQDHAQQVQDLEQRITDRDEQFQNDIAAEVARRETANQLAAEYENGMKDLEVKLAEVEERMLADLAARDARILQLEQTLAERDQQIEGYEMDIRSLENQMDIEKTNNADSAEELNGTIKLLQENIGSHSRTILELQEQAATTAEFHNNEIEDRNAEIATLHGKIALLQTDMSELEREKAGLERRVESEAEAMLELQNAKEDEIDELMHQITVKQDKILVVEQKSVDADKRWQELLAARDEEIAELKTSASGNTEEIETLSATLNVNLEKFKEYIRRSKATIAKLQDAAATNKAVADEEGDVMQADGDGMLEELERMDVVGEMKITRSSASTSAMQSSQSQTQTVAGSSAKKGRGKKGKRVVDSGIGMDGEEELAA
ncbi:hypothetical protein B0A50_08428 [Salinomyces thailandicus]|uniref:Uncharacterized protein n=1 Tax=Salinomyces thailandicus TaxID=706561 RepID=A0A4U0TJV8_9PEZI|nr:hypothetical protein B0A50_08428 [Salinomyces thailandica]